MTTEVAYHATTATGQVRAVVFETDPPAKERKAKAEQLLGWRPKRSNQDTLLAAYTWYHAHRDEVKATVGTTHTVGWNQKILKVFKRLA